MTRADILARVSRVAAECFACRPTAITEATVAADIERWDSLRHLIFVSSIEQEFGIEFDMDAIAGLTDVGELVGAILALAE